MDKLNISAFTKLANGVEMPRLGLGVFQSQDGQEVINAVKYAWEAGYRLIDTARAYQNERGVGEAVKKSGINRGEIFITSKVWNSDQGYDSTLKAFDSSLKRLGMDYLDLYLIHWPVKDKYKDTWKALEKLYSDGKVKAIGVSNFLQHHLTDLMNSATVMPMVNQVEYHPYLTQPDLISFCRENNIQVQSWSPIMKGKVFDIPLLVEIAQKYSKTPAQLVIRWNLQNGIVTIPKSVNRNRIESNANIFDFEITHEDMELISGLNKNERIGPDPDNFDF